MDRVAWAGGFLVALELCSGVCAQRATWRHPEVQPLVLGIRDRLAPEGGRSVAFSGLNWDSSGVRASWDVETAMDWPAYTAWVKTRLPPDFELVSEGRSWISLATDRVGGYYGLRLTPLPSTEPLRIHAEFEGRPQ